VIVARTGTFLSGKASELVSFITVRVESVGVTEQHYLF